MLVKRICTMMLTNCEVPSRPAVAVGAFLAARWMAIVVTAVAAGCVEPDPVTGFLQGTDAIVQADGSLDGTDPPDTATPTIVVPDGCVHDSQCAAYGMVCNTATNTCVGCLTDQNCPSAQFCLDQQCWDDVCTPGDTRCYGVPQIAMCAANGGAWLPTDCPAGTYCANDACVPLACKPGSVRCDGTVVMQCRADGSGEDADEDCAKTDRVCVAGACKPKTCAKGQVGCADQDTALLCENPDKGWKSVECDDGDPCTFDLCQAGTGCTHPPKPNGMACGQDSWCMAGQCTAVTNNLMVIFDTSGSMSFKVPGKICYDQSWPSCVQPNQACDRMGVSKNTFAKAFSLVDSSKTRVGMFRFPQVWLPPEATVTPKPPYYKPPVACANGYYFGYNTITGHTQEETINGDTGWFWDNLDEILCVPFPTTAGVDPKAEILSWMDGKEEYGVEPELRAIGGTPIGRTLFYVGEYLRNRVVIDGKPCTVDADCANPNYLCDAGACRDPARACRQTTIVVFTDGGEKNLPDKLFSPWVQAKRLAYGLRCKSDADCVGGARCLCPPTQPGCADAQRECLPESLETGFYCRETMASCIPSADPSAPGYCPKKNGQNQCVEDPVVGVAAEAEVFANNVLRSPDGQPFGVTVHVVDISNEPIGVERSGNLARAGGGLLLAPDGADENAFLASLVKAFDVKPKPSCGVGVLPCGTAGFSASCDDGNACTNDACNQTTGTCSHTVNVSECDDGNACTLSDRCLDGECRPGIAWVETKAGNGLSQPSLGEALVAGLPTPRGPLELDDASVVVSDGNRLVRLQDGKLVAFAGTKDPGTKDGPASEARFLLPSGLSARQVSGGAGIGGKMKAVVVADTGNRRVRSIELVSQDGALVAGAVTTLAGSVAGFVDGPAATARFADPIDVSVDHDDSVLVVDRGNQRLRRIAGTEVSTIVGDGIVGNIDGPLASARLADPIAVDVGVPGTIFLAQRYRIRRISGGGILTVVGGAPGYSDGVGDKAQFDEISGIAVRGDGGLVVADHGNHRMRMVSPAFAATTIAGNKQSGWIDGFAGGARFWGIADIDLGAGGRIWIADQDNHRLRLLQLPEVNCPDGGPCNAGSCDPAKGTCVSKPRPDGAACDIGTCLQGETCSALVCQGGTPVDCDDGEACTADSCQPETGLCVHAPIQGNCDDGSACTEDDSCNAGLCIGSPLNCDDGDSVTADSCEAGQCLHRVTSCTKDGECYDGESACSVDTCKDGACVYTPTGKAGCCQPTLWRVDFDDGKAGDLQLISSLGSGKGWLPWLSDLDAAKVLAYGDPKLGSFDLVPGAGHSGQAIRAKLALPQGRKAVVAARMWIDTERAALYDALTLRARWPGNDVLLWQKGPKTTMKTWITVEAPLDAYAGRTIDLELGFDTIDGQQNTGKGVFVDWIEIRVECAQ